ncbi:MAG: MerR family transcriptional regulator [Anaerolineae bacterium]|nr:MerR family transcriptional regulator [Anaerolineae bacterium]
MSAVNETRKPTLTIGQLAKRAGLPTSTIRYYEAEGLLEPARRTDAGYRLYTPEAEQTLSFIQRAQRLGFSLRDVRALLEGLRARDLSDRRVIDIAEARFLALERQLTELLVQRHEMGLFLLDFRQQMAAQTGVSSALFDRLVDRVCNGLPDQSPDGTLAWLVEHTGCALAEPDAQQVLETLRGHHVHIWQRDDVYYILVVGHDPEVKAALETLTELEGGCTVHPAPELFGHKEGYLLAVRGPNAFIYARLFLTLEQDLFDTST